jgi:hypothetical protein
MEQFAGLPLAYPNGHFYSPVVSQDDIGDGSRVWKRATENAGINFDFSRQRAFIEGTLRRWFPVYRRHFVRPPSDKHFSHDNATFSWLDAPVLFAMLNQRRPRRMIEVGSGRSSMLAAETNLAFLDGLLDLTCIEPYPKAFLRDLKGVSRLIERRVQDVALETFDALDAGDVLFIDSSHVSKTGSDLNHLVFEVLPRIKPGVLVHFHDIFLPKEYPRDWVLKIGLSWNEQYLVRALLMGSDVFEILFGCTYAEVMFPALLEQIIGNPGYGGGSLWLRKTRDF